MSFSHRLARYGALAAAPAVVTSAAVADTYDASGTGPITASTASTTFDTVIFQSLAGLQFSVFAWQSNGASQFATAGLAIPHGANRNQIQSMRWFVDGTQSRIVSTSATGGVSQWGYGGWRNSNVTWGADLADVGHGYIGFTLTKKLANGGETINGFIEYSLSVGSHLEFTLLSWAFNVGSAVTMPANSGTPAVPGLGGLAALACGAAGVRRKRTRVA